MKISLITLFCLAALLSGCMPAPEKRIDTHDWQKATQEVVQEYAPYAKHELKPAFRRAGVRYPPRQLALLAFKKEKHLEMWAKDYAGSWRHIKDYRITAHSGGPGPKLRKDDAQIPEGIYHIVEFNPFSALHLSLKLDYPNEFDRLHAKQDGRKALGGNIFIHGENASVGCIAIGNRAIDQLFVLTNKVGLGNIKVIIASNDLRDETPVSLLGKHPLWVPLLDSKIAMALAPFRKV